MRKDVISGEIAADQIDLKSGGPQAVRYMRLAGVAQELSLRSHRIDLAPHALNES